MAGDLSIEQRKWIFKQYRKTENAERVEAFNTIYYVLYTYFWPTLYIGKITNRVKETQLDAKLILSIFRQSLRVSGVSKPIIRRYNRMYTTFGTCYYFYTTVCCAGWIGTIQPAQQTDI